MQNNVATSMLHYKEYGTGKAVLFLHGFLESHTMWDVLDLSKESFKAIVIDLPGHGMSTIESYPYPSMDWMAQQVLALVDFLKIESFDVVGHSMGGYVGLALKKNSTKCKKVILLNSNFWEDSAEKKKDRIRVAEIVLTKKNEFIKQVIPNLFGHSEHYKTQIDYLVNEALRMDGTDIAFSSLAMSQRENHADLVKKYQKDIFIIQGEIDNLISLEMMSKKLASLTEVDFKVMTDSGHMSHFESTFDVRKHLIQILQKN